MLQLDMKTLIEQRKKPERINRPGLGVKDESTLSIPVIL